MTPWKCPANCKRRGWTSGRPRAFRRPSARHRSRTLGELATKGEIKAEVSRLETKMDREFKLVKWMLGVLLAGVASLILKTFFGD